MKWSQDEPRDEVLVYQTKDGLDEMRTCKNYLQVGAEGLVEAKRAPADQLAGIHGI